MCFAAVTFSLFTEIEFSFSALRASPLDFRKPVSVPNASVIELSLIHI